MREQVWLNGLFRKCRIPNGDMFLCRVSIVPRAMRYFPEKKRFEKKSVTGTVQRTGILSRNEKFSRDTRTTRIDGIPGSDRMFDFHHDICRNHLYAMVCVHVMNYFLCNLPFAYPGCLK